VQGEGGQRDSSQGQTVVSWKISCCSHCEDPDVYYSSRPVSQHEFNFPREPPARFSLQLKRRTEQRERGRELRTVWREGRKKLLRKGNFLTTTGENMKEVSRTDPSYEIERKLREDLFGPRKRGERRIELPIVVITSSSFPPLLRDSRSFSSFSL